MVLEAKNISFRYGTDSRQILNDFNLKLTQEERVGLIAQAALGKPPSARFWQAMRGRTRGRFC